MHPRKGIRGIAAHAPAYEITPLGRELAEAREKTHKLQAAVKALLQVPEVRKAAANWASDQLIAVRELT
jgi:hypothetical protein